MCAGALAVASIALLAAGHEAFAGKGSGDLAFSIVIEFGSLLYVAIGLLIAARTRSVIGWFLTTVGVFYGLMVFGTAYAVVGVLTSPGSLPAAREVGAAFGQFWAYALVTLAMLLLVFPDGRPPSPRWRPVLWLGIGGGVTSYLLFPREADTAAPSHPTFT